MEVYRKVFSEKGFRLIEVRPLFFTLLSPSGVTNPFLRWIGIMIWEALTWMARWELPGNLLGRALYGVDSFLRRIFKRGPGGHMAVFRFEGAR